MFNFAKPDLKDQPLAIALDSKQRNASPFRYGLPLVFVALIGISGVTLFSSPSTTAISPITQATIAASSIQPASPIDAALDLTPSLDLDNLAEDAQASLETEEDSVQNANNESEHDGWHEHTIKSGESLSSIFNSLSLGQPLLVRINAATPKEYSLKKVKPGQTIKVKRDAEGALEELVWVKSPVESMRLSPKGDSFSFEKVTQALERRQHQVSGAIQSSLFLDAQKQGLSDKTIMTLMDIFKWDVDFALGLKKGDRFSLVYDEYYLDGKKYSNGNVLAAEFVNKGKSYRAVRYEDGNGKVDYFTPEGKSMRKAFIMTPLNFTRISSNFTPDRWHPVLQKWRAHKGVDYAAPVGTSVKAAADGKIVYSGWQGGYGNVVIIEHGKQHSTVYGHLSKFAANAKVGGHVNQGEVIGFVGQTGLASGPHLHYEVRVAGKQVDPVKVASLGVTREVPKQDAKQFKTRAQQLFSQLELLKSDRVAQLMTAKPVASVE